MSAPRRALAVLARFPEPGAAKTRLIPALGRDGAAAIHDELVRHTLGVVEELRATLDVDTRMWVCGAEPRTFAARFGEDVPCKPQCEGDLGQRMADALQSMLARADAAILIGTDCPDLSVGLLVEAFEALRTSDVVIGPAFDGGYYLIGLRRQAPALFEGVAWGTSEVLAATLARAASLGLVVHKLPTLSDVDEPGDLAVWERVKAGCQTVGVPPELSIVIPTLDEAAEIAGLLRRLRQPGVELIVADGGSCDRTREIAAACGARVVRASPGRGTQMNAGSAVARGGVLLFLHADTSLPDDFIELIREALSDPSVAVGAFRFAIERAGVTSRLLESAVRLRCKLLRLPYGDQAYFMSRETFDRLGGFAEIPLMEDVDLVRRARRLGRVVVLDAAATTSARRWERAGLLRTTAVNQACLVGYALGVSPQRLARWRRGLSG